MKIIQWLLTLRAGKQLLACTFITILFLAGGWANEKREYSNYRTANENKNLENEIRHTDDLAAKYERIIEVKMENNLELIRLHDKVDSLTKIIVKITLENESYKSRHH